MLKEKLQQTVTLTRVFYVMDMFSPGRRREC